MGTRSEKTYKRLPGKKKNIVVGLYTLYQGPDHLLMIFSRFGNEDYKRFYYTDIQAISTRKTSSGMIQNIIIAAIGILFGLFLLSDNEASVAIGAVMAAIFGIFLLINALRGPTCETLIQTAVQTERLYPLNRLRTANKVMGRLRPLITRAQGQLTTESIDNKPVRAESANGAVSSSDQADTKKKKKKKKSEKGTVHLTVFSLFIIDTVIVLLNTTLHITALMLISTILTLLLGIGVIVALIKQQDSNLPRPVCLLTWTALGYLCVSWVVGYFSSVAMMIDNPQIMGNQWKMMEYFASFRFFESPLISVIHAMTIGSAIGIGLPGLLLLNQYLKSGKKKTAPAGQSKTAQTARNKTEAPAGS